MRIFRTHDILKLIKITNSYLSKIPELAGLIQPLKLALLLILLSSLEQTKGGTIHINMIKYNPDLKQYIQIV